MPIHVEPSDLPDVAVPRALLTDSRLSLAARGLLVTLIGISAEGYSLEAVAEATSSLDHEIADARFELVCAGLIS